MREHKVLFWDFDGVIKESVDVKTRAYVGLFGAGDRELSERVRGHHEANGGMSRYEKIPLYLGWAGRAVSREEVERYCAKFSQRVVREVIDSPWVPGAHEYLQRNHGRQRFVLISATPQAEMELIARELGISAWFDAIHGSPTAKSDAIAKVLQHANCTAADAIVIGDSLSDYDAALRNGVAFLLRRTSINQPLQRLHTGAQIEDFAGG